MGYQHALEKAWDAASGLHNGHGTTAVKLLADTYTVNFPGKSMLSDSCNTPAKEHVSISIVTPIAANTIFSGVKIIARSVLGNMLPNLA